MDSLLQQNLKLDTKLGSDSESLEIFPVPESDTFTSYLENQFSKIDNLSEQDLDSMVEQNLELDSAFKKDSQSNFSFPDADLSYEGTLTDMSEGFSVDDVDPAQDDEFVSTASKLPLENKPQQHMGSSNTVCSPFALSIPPALAAKVATGNYKLILEPLVSSDPSIPLTFVYTAVPTPQCMPTVPSTPVVCENLGNVASASKSDQESDGTVTDDNLKADTPTIKTPNQSSSTKKRGVGSSHKGGTMKSYSLWLHMGITKDIRLNGMTIKAALEKYDAPRRRLMEWLKEYDIGAYAELPDYYTQEELKKLKKLPGGGRPLKDPELEQKLVNYYNELNEDLFPISSELLTYECLAHNENFLGGVESPNFKSRIADFLRNWRKRNAKHLRVPTSTEHHW